MSDAKSPADGSTVQRSTCFVQADSPRPYERAGKQVAGSQATAALVRARKARTHALGVAYDLQRALLTTCEMLAMLVQAKPAVVEPSLRPAGRRPDRSAEGGRLRSLATHKRGRGASRRAAGVDMVSGAGLGGGWPPRRIRSERRMTTGSARWRCTPACDAVSPARDRGGRHHGWRGNQAALALGAVAAQLGTAFIACPESSADEAYRAALHGPGANHTVMTRVISGRPARCLANRFTEWAAKAPAETPDYPIAYDAGKPACAAKAAGESGFGAAVGGPGRAAQPLDAGRRTRGAALAGGDTDVFTAGACPAEPG